MSAPELSQYPTEGEGKGRAYRHPFRLNDKGKPLVVPSVTTILKLENKEGLSQYAADQTMLWAAENWSLLGQRSDEQAFKTGRYRWRDAVNERAFVGTGIHETIESLNTGGWNFPDLDDEQEAIMLQWHALNEVWEIEPLLSEFTVWSLEHEYSGTADGYYRMTHRVTGETFLALIDLKTSKKTWDAHHMQMAALAKADVLMSKQPDGTWVELPTPEFEAFKLIHLRSEFWDIIDVPDIELRFEQFLGYRKVWAAREKIAAAQKQREIDTAGFKEVG